MPEIPWLDIERFTGSGSTLNVDGNRQSAAERAIARLDGIDNQKLRQEATADVSGNNEEGLKAICQFLAMVTSLV